MDKLFLLFAPPAKMTPITWEKYLGMADFLAPWQRRNIAAFALNAALTFGVGTGGQLGAAIGAKSNVEISEKYPSLVTPAGWAFAIWGPIFTLEACFTVWQALALAGAEPAFVAASPYWCAGCALQAVWTLAFAFERPLPPSAEKRAKTGKRKRERGARYHVWENDHTSGELEGSILRGGACQSARARSIWLRLRTFGIVVRVVHGLHGSRRVVIRVDLLARHSVVIVGFPPGLGAGSLERHHGSARYETSSEKKKTTVS